MWLPGVLDYLFVCAFTYQNGSEYGFSTYLQKRQNTFTYTLWFPTKNLQMDTKFFYLTLKSTLEMFGSSPMKEKTFTSAPGCLWGLFAIFKLKSVILLWLWKSYCTYNSYISAWRPPALTAKPSGIQTTELFIVWYPGSSLMRMKTPAPFHFTNFFFFLPPSCRYFSAFHPWRSSN